MKIPVLAISFLAAAAAAAQGGYQKPPQPVLDVLNSPPTPAVSISPTRDRMLLIDTVRYPPISDLAQPMLRLAGLRINPRTNGRAIPRRIVGLRVKAIPGGEERRIAVPADSHLGQPNWSPDGKRVAITRTVPEGVELWVADASTGAARALRGVRLNTAYGSGFDWMPDGKTLLCQIIDPDRGPPPLPPAAPDGPTVQETGGGSAPVRTFQDLLRDPHDARLFEYYATSRPALVEADSGKLTPVGKPAVYASVRSSPDGMHFLVERTHRPYSYLLPADAFPTQVELWSRAGKVERVLADLPLQDGVPIGGVPTGPRGGHQWVPTEPATLVWAEALDGGDPRKKVSHRDQVRVLAAPFSGEPRDWLKTEHRFSGIDWIEPGDLALFSDFDRDRLRRRTFLCAWNRPGAAPRLLWDLATRDRYRHPGTPLTRTLPNGQRAILRHNNSIYLAGPGASPEGDRPFLDRLLLPSSDRIPLSAVRPERLFHSAPEVYETVVAMVNPDGPWFITSRESKGEPPNYNLRSRTGPPAPLTSFPDPAPQLRGITKRLVNYTRADGVPLSFTLYLPPGYREGTRLPTLVWAYPLEFADADVAGQVFGSSHRFTTISGISHLFFLLHGYAVLDDAAMPVVGNPETVNDTFIDQIVSSARAAIDKAVELGVTDRNRVGVGGHSYGAFMTANLLAHSDLFRAGIARSGAYNRTLTPFGFQSERRTLWEAPDLYLKVSPFLYANRIKEPLLLIHGEADNNAGTFPIQSERLYHALKGNGGTARYVTLPHESHGYAARESVEHTLYEMLAWSDRHVKNAPSTTAGSAR